jgi:CheY-like chemotaxis protein
MAVDVLIIDDDLDVREALSTILEREGYAVASAADGAEALAWLAREEPPALILLDLMMPVMNGWEFREHQSSDARLSAVPVVVISVTDNIGALGPIAGFIRKPFTLSQVLAAVARFAHPLPR